MGWSFVDEVGDVLVGMERLAEGDEFGADQGVDCGHGMGGSFIQAFEKCSILRGVDTISAIARVKINGS